MFQWLRKMLKKDEWGVEAFHDEVGSPRFRVRGRNGEIVLSSEAYSSAQARDESLDRLLRVRLVRIVAPLAALLLLAASSWAGWSAPVHVTTPWVEPNHIDPQAPLPVIAEQMVHAASFSIPAAPPGATQVRTTLQRSRWRMDYQTQNLASEPVTIGVEGHYVSLISHGTVRSFIYGSGQVGGVTPSGDLLGPWSAWYARAMTVGTGGAGVSFVAPPGAVLSGSVFQEYDYTVLPGGGAIDLHPIELFSRTRNGQHVMTICSQGGYSWTWSTPPSWQGTHSPVPYTGQTWCQAEFTVEWYVP
jgi:hypothetical protein